MRIWTVIVAALALFFLSACNKKKPEPVDTLNPMDHAVRTPTPAPRSVLRKTFAVETYVAFPVDVPIHSHSPSLKGNFTSYRYQSSGSRLSDEAASIDLLLLDEQQYETFTHGPSEDITRSAQNTHEQAIDWSLGATNDLPRKYYLVFNNATGKPKTKLVDADFNLTFE